MKFASLLILSLALTAQTSHARGGGVSGGGGNGRRECIQYTLDKVATQDAGIATKEIIEILTHDCNLDDSQRDCLKENAADNITDVTLAVGICRLSRLFILSP